jgi:AcrR family transcriptional regulator
MADAPKPRDRVLTAAFDEFAEHGITGARIDRIARSAKTSKERVYAYFRSKEELYTAIVDAQSADAISSVALDLQDLPRYVGDLFDYFAANPKLLRLMNWGRLAPSGPSTHEGEEIRAAKVKAIADAQATGTIADDLPALDVVLLLLTLATTWLASTEFHSLCNPADPSALAARRAAAVAAATRLFPPSRAAGAVTPAGSSGDASLSNRL